MSATELTPGVDVRGANTRSDEDDLDHITECHNDDRAMCGADLTGVPIVDDDDYSNECIVCYDLLWVHCGCDCGCCDDADER